MVAAAGPLTKVAEFVCAACRCQVNVWAEPGETINSGPLCNECVRNLLEKLAAEGATP